MTIALLNTRPIHQADALNLLLEENGIECLSCPTLKINLFEEPAHLEPSLSFDKTIFISSNAIQGFLKQPKQVINAALSHSKLYAIGRATRDYGLEQGFNVEMLSEQRFDSEHLLAHPVMQDVSAENILLVKGVAGRNLIESTLSSRGANVVRLEVYSRESEKFCVDSWQKLLSYELPVLLITSVASWQAIVDAQTAHYQIKHKLADGSLYADASWHNLKHIIAMSQRIADEIRKDGWQGNIKVVETQSNQGIIDTLIELHTHSKV